VTADGDSPLPADEALALARGLPLNVDDLEILVEGPWRHRFVAANGGRFHVAEAGRGPLVMLLHGFPEFWWAWRHQLPALADAGYRAVAMDLRGYGASDKPPRGYDTMSLAADVAGVIRALGERHAIVVGHDWGGWLAWSMPGLAAAETRAVAAVSMAHPLTLRAALLRDGHQRRAWSEVRDFQVPMRPERQLTRGDLVARLLKQWSGPATDTPATPTSPGHFPGAHFPGHFPGGHFPDPATITTYSRAIRVPFVAHSSMEYYRWAIRSLPRRDGRRFAAAVRPPVTVPVLQIQGGADPFVLPETALASHARVSGPLRYELLPDAGHFPPEECPGEVTAHLLDWLAQITRRPSG
jgi:pimeloyl-ACP methyl ester carboxylesterase